MFQCRYIIVLLLKIDDCTTILFYYLLLVTALFPFSVGSFTKTITDNTSTKTNQGRLEKQLYSAANLIISKEV